MTTRVKHHPDIVDMAAKPAKAQQGYQSGMMGLRDLFAQPKAKRRAFGQNRLTRYGLGHEADFFTGIC